MRFHLTTVLALLACAPWEATADALKHKHTHHHRVTHKTVKHTPIKHTTRHTTKHTAAPHSSVANNNHSPGGGSAGSEAPRSSFTKVSRTTIKTTSHKPASTANSGSQRLDRAHTAVSKMQTFYNSYRAGQWSPGWWNGANAYITLADLRARDNSNFIKKITDGPNGVLVHSLSTQGKTKTGAVDWDNWWDDCQWWALALIKGFDVTGNKTMLTTARATWELVRSKAMGPPCGGLYNAAEGIKGRGQSTIATLLYVEVASLLAVRYPADHAMFVAAAKKQWTWIMNNVYQYNYIRGDGQMPVSPGSHVCANNGAILSYLEGTAINALIALNQATGDYSYIDLANGIALKSFSDMGLNRSGILHDNCDMNFGCNPDEAQFKGIFMRSLRNLYDIQPAAANGLIPGFLKQNADSIWSQTRSGNGFFGQKWDGPYNPTSNAPLSFSQHTAGTMAMVAAALL